MASLGTRPRRGVPPVGRTGRLLTGCRLWPPPPRTVPPERATREERSPRNAPPPSLPPKVSSAALSVSQTSFQMPRGGAGGERNPVVRASRGTRRADGGCVWGRGDEPTFRSGRPQSLCDGGGGIIWCHKSVTRECRGTVWAVWRGLRPPKESMPCIHAHSPCSPGVAPTKGAQPCIAVWRPDTALWPAQWRSPQHGIACRSCSGPARDGEAQTWQLRLSVLSVFRSALWRWGRCRRVKRHSMEVGEAGVLR